MCTINEIEEVYGSLHLYFPYRPRQVNPEYRVFRQRLLDSQKRLKLEEEHLKTLMDLAYEPFVTTLPLQSKIINLDRQTKLRILTETVYPIDERFIKELRYWDRPASFYVDVLADWGKKLMIERNFTADVEKSLNALENFTTNQRVLQSIDTKQSELDELEDSGT